MANLLELDIEHLENRRLLAGNVDLSVSNSGNVSLDGDNQSNEIVIESASGYGNAAMVRGVNGTTINGSAGVAFVPLDGDLRINLRDGDNRLLVHGGDNSAPSDFEEDISIRTGNGSDIIVLEIGTLEGNLNVRTRGGDDLVVVEGGQLNGRTSVNTSSGNDIAGFSSSVVNDRARFNMGSGDDAVLITESAVDRLNISMGSGNDHFATENSVFTERARLNGNRNTDTYWSNDQFSFFFDVDFDSFENESELDQFEDLFRPISPVFDDAVAFLNANGF